MTYFDVQKLPEPRDGYVAWIDVMGIQSHMASSINVTANFVFKLHVAALDAPRIEIDLYPVMDGFYATSQSRSNMELFLRRVFRSLARLFCEQSFQFIIKGAIAFGQIYHGRDVGDEASKRLAENPNYRASILLGIPMVDAYKSEKEAPPFGIYVHETARLSTPEGEEPFSSEWWPWFDVNFDIEEFRKHLQEYFNRCEKFADKLHYNRDRIDFHRKLALQYFRR